MATVKTTRYFLGVFGSVQRKFMQVSGDANSPKSTDAFQYKFPNDEEFFNHFRMLKVKTVRGQLLKGNTLVGVYEREGAERYDRPRPRVNSEKFKEKKVTI